MRFHHVPRSMLADLWPVIGPLLKKAERFSSFITIDTIYESALAGRTAIIIGTTERGVVAACALEVLSFSAKRIVNIYALGAEHGFMRHMPAAYSFLLNWAYTQRCNGLMLTGRPGWRRIAKGLGAKYQMCTHAWMEIP